MVHYRLPQAKSAVQISPDFSLPSRPVQPGRKTCGAAVPSPPPSAFAFRPLTHSANLLHERGINDVRKLCTVTIAPHLRRPAFALPVMESIHEGGVIPALDVVIRAVVNLDFDRIPVVVDQEDDGVRSVADHGRDVLRRYL